MSPEQARGEAASRQADIWSFGVVLYELLTGASPFGRPTTADTLASVLGTQPDYSVLPSDTPANVRHLVRRCLEKDRKRRLQHMGDVRIEVEDALAALTAEPRARSGGRSRRECDDGGEPPARSRWPCSPESPGGCSPIVPLPRLLPPWSVCRSPRWNLRAVLAVRSRSPGDFSGWVPRGLCLRQSALDSPDGSKGGRRDRGRCHRIRSFPRTANGWVFSVTGGETGLKKVPALGGTPVPIVTTSERPGGGTWRADGTIVFATSEGLYQVSENGGEPRLLVKPDPRRKERAYAWPQFMPDGRSVLFTMVPDDSIEGAQIAVLDLNTLETRIVLKGGSAARYASTGHLVYTSGQTLKAIAFDPDTQQTRGDPVSLPDIEIATTPDNGAAEFAVSETGTLLFITPSVPGQALRTLSWVDRQGKEEPLALAPGRYAIRAHLTGRNPRGPRHSRRQSGYLDLEPPTVEPDEADERSDRGHVAGVEPGRPPRVLRVGPDRELRRVLASR